MEIILTLEQEEAIAKKYGSLDYIQSNAEVMANNAIREQINNERQIKIRAIVELSDVELDVIALPILEAKEEARVAAEEAELAIEGAVKLIEVGR